MIDLKHEYRNTRVGLIPQDWELTKLGKVVKFYDSKRKPIKESERKKGTYPYYGASGIIDYVEDYLFDGDYLLLAEDGANILTRNTPIAFKVSGKFWVNNHAHVLKPLVETDMEYLKYYLSYISYDKYNTSSAQPKLSRKSSESIDVILPKNKSVRKKIGVILSTWDKAIELKQQLIDLKIEQKKGLMQKLLTGKVRLAGYEEEWIEEKLGQVIDFYNGFAFKSKNYLDNGRYKVITIANVQDGKLNLDKVNRVDSLPRDIKEYQILKKGDIVLSMTGNVGRVCKIDSENNLLNQRVGKIKAKNICEPFLYYLLRSDNFLNKMISIAQGGAQDNLSVKDIKKHKLLIPSDISEQEEISKIFDKYENEINLLENELKNLKEQKKGLMQQLLTGKTRVKV